MEKLEEAAKLASELKIERPYSLPGILLGTSAFTANGWQGSFSALIANRSTIVRAKPTGLGQSNGDVG